MERYKILKVVGDGAYGSVYKALNKNTGEIVAIKKMKKKFTSWEECMSLREIKSLRKLSHPNVIKLKEVIRANDELNFIFEYLEQNIYQVTRDNSGSLNNSMIKSIIKQTLQGLAYIHRNGFFHRDMKPENLMIHNGNLKIADFGLAREIRSKPPFTDYVSTRWYRAPEILLRSTNYNSPVDIFALGTIMAELYLLRPLFPGSNERDQLLRICNVLGSPTMQSWPEGHRLASKVGFNFPNATSMSLQKIIPNAPIEAIDLILKMITFDPQKRPTAVECLEHPFFQDLEFLPSEVQRDTPKKLSKPAPYFDASSKKLSREGKEILKDISTVPNYANIFPSTIARPTIERSTHENAALAPIDRSLHGVFDGLASSKRPVFNPLAFKSNSVSYLEERRAPKNLYNPLKVDLPSYNAGQELYKGNYYPSYGNKANEGIDSKHQSVFKPPAYYRPTLALPLRETPKQLAPLNYHPISLKRNMFDREDPFSI